MFVDTTWAEIDSLKEFLREREVSLYTKYFIFSELMKYLQEHARVEHVPNGASKAIKEERASSPNLVIKQACPMGSLSLSTQL